MSAFRLSPPGRNRGLLCGQRREEPLITARRPTDPCGCALGVDFGSHIHRTSCAGGGSVMENHGNAGRCQRSLIFVRLSRLRIAGDLGKEGRRILRLAPHQGTRRDP